MEIMIITSAKLITCQHSATPITDGAVVINKGIISAIGQAGYLSNRYPKQDVLRLQNVVIMPGLVNAHVHLELPPLLDSIRAQTFTDWVLNLIQAKKKLKERDYSSAAFENMHTVTRTGTTTVAEICTHAASPPLIKKIGLRAIVYNEIINMGPRLLVPSHKDSTLVKFGLSPHTPYTVSRALLLEIEKLAQMKQLRLAMHIAESKDELKLLQGKKSQLEKLFEFAHWDLSCSPQGSSSFEYLDRIGFLSPRLLAVHAVQAKDSDVRIIKKNKVSIAHCPRSNRELNVGRMPLKKYLDAGIAVGLGTDSLASVTNLNMWDEMRYAFQLHRQDGITAEDIFKLATIRGARALGLDNEIGTLEPGKKADIIAVPLPKKNTGNLYSDLLRETKSCIICMVNGNILYQE
ncbi:MAG TPA: amidohydrolase family protein [Nitrospirota bacterium]|nr:amidohydrolase family protein [Nitrospirota bacterium]